MCTMILKKMSVFPEMVDKDSTVSEKDAEGLYIPAKLNEYVRANPNQVKGTTLKTWVLTIIMNLVLQIIKTGALFNKTEWR